MTHPPTRMRRSRRLRARLRGREATIRRMLAERAAARAWLRGEFEIEPVERRWSCMWCGAMLRGGREAAKEHVCLCDKNPLVQQVEQLQKQLSEAERSARVAMCDAARAEARLGVLELDNEELRTIRRGRRRAGEGEDR